MKTLQEWKNLAHRELTGMTGDFEPINTMQEKIQDIAAERYADSRVQSYKNELKAKIEKEVSESNLILSKKTLEWVISKM